jgi:hypothetical protein
MTPAEQSNQPLSRLDERVDDLLRALGRMPGLAGVVTTMRLHEEMVAQVGPDIPGAVDILAGAEFRRALINVMDEVLVVKRKGADRGHTS